MDYTRMMNELKAEKVRHGYSDAQLAKATGLGRQAFNRKLNHPEEFRVDELQNLLKVLHMKMEVKIAEH